MYALLLFTHSLLRWAVLVAGVLAVIRAFRGPDPGAGATKPPGLAFLIAVDLQLVIGLLLLFVASPITHAAFQNMHAAMKVHVLRFFTVEHPVLGIACLVLVHATRILARKAPSPAVAYRRARVGFLLALIAAILAVPWPFLAYGRPWLGLP